MRKTYRVTWFPEHRWPFEHEFESAMMALDAVISILRETEHDFDWDEGPDALLADVVQMMQEPCDRGERWEICVLPGQLYITAHETEDGAGAVDGGRALLAPTEEDGAGAVDGGRALLAPTEEDGAGAVDGGLALLAPTEEDEGCDEAGGHYCAVTPAGTVVHRGTEKDCCEYVERMERLGGIECVGRLRIERDRDASSVAAPGDGEDGFLRSLRSVEMTGSGASKTPASTGPSGPHPLRGIAAPTGSVEMTGNPAPADATGGERRG